MADSGDSFDKLADTNTWKNIFVLFDGFLGPTPFKTLSRVA
ncbi:hypothetical protein [Halorussus salinisoli]|nr:hypothetical protein [Halorussus salinisoli]